MLQNLRLTKKFDLLPTEKGYILKILIDIDTTKSTGIDRLPARFLKDGAILYLNRLQIFVIFEYVRINSQLLSN